MFLSNILIIVMFISSLTEVVQNETMEVANDVKKVESEENNKTKLSVDENNEKTNGRALTDTGNCYW